ncbi:hydrolase, NUDIX family protein [Segniliparus rotundus DSM 44985]|uniref:Hydrolase, NUDIX family protein n=1 Tax=Segniliparus rotundus (strain ATCC BAA-972 / CDC 1076 / CIP 108378 / DSM 44985 / JCM 13578) TaxID=640132 RepID=D6Z8I3_SEGRD|nr:NUDIX hydrolase [Segniliparus rotundus]ADG98263.1 hydrolase, NUDIX family protein [Segniliparus rotundus DSM 44985]
MLLFAVLIGVLLAGLALFVGWMVRTARRLDRLHVRRDLAWQGLLAALDRRALVARTIAATLGPAGAELAGLARAVESSAVAGPGREQWESRLSVCLAEVEADTLTAQLVEERSDAEARVRFARCFYNDAVRDTRELRARPAVRVFKLAGGAPLPEYFEIVEAAPSTAE